MENLAMSKGVNREFWSGKRVLVTGHTGFKGSWLSLWLSDMGAEVYGYALNPPTVDNFFSIASLEECLASSTIGDVRDADALSKAITNASPEIVFHLAAQPLVRYSYSAPVETYAVNVMGTVNLLEAARKLSSIKAIVNVTTDKVYENREWVWPYREGEPLGGLDPYSSSKACSELVTAAYRASFLNSKGIKLASARAGNVIGGGDWAQDRLLPDFFRAIDAHTPITIRSPSAVRPWQHVLEPVSGYLMLAEALCDSHLKFAEDWNFGPDERDARTVQWILEYLCDQIPGASWLCDASPQPHEAHFLRLDSSKAKDRLGWSPRWSLEVAIEQTCAWHRAWKSEQNMQAFSRDQIKYYENFTA